MADSPGYTSDETAVETNGKETTSHASDSSRRPRPVRESFLTLTAMYDFVERLVYPPLSVFLYMLHWVYQEACRLLFVAVRIA